MAPSRVLCLLARPRIFHSNIFQKDSFSLATTLVVQIPTATKTKKDIEFSYFWSWPVDPIPNSFFWRVWPSRIIYWTCFECYMSLFYMEQQDHFGSYLNIAQKKCFFPVYVSLAGSRSWIYHPFPIKMREIWPCFTMLCFTSQYQIPLVYSVFGWIIYPQNAVLPGLFTGCKPRNSR